MLVQIKVNGKLIKEDVSCDLLLIDFLRNHGCYSVKRGCETIRANNHSIMTLEGLQKEAKVFADFMANEGAEQCGFCSPGLIMNVLAMEKELKNPSEEEIKNYLAGNLCRCTGYMAQMRAITKYLNRGV